MGSIGQQHDAAKYEQERAKRFNERGTDQYFVLNQSEKYQHLSEDIWVAPGTPIHRPVPDGGHVRIVIYGAGYGGIIAAVNLLKVGFEPEDLLIVDPAGGFGGTWYYNRFPGLHCDVESSLYLPFLEETGYMPKKRYSTGLEIRLYIEQLVRHFGLQDRAMFQSAGRNVEWDEGRKRWVSRIVSRPRGGEEESITITSDFAYVQFGVLPNPKLPDIPGIEAFNGPMFHTARWDYSCTGGTQETPVLTGLEGKRVGVVGTGATMIQAFSHIAEYAKETYLFQRTPAAVDVRDNRPIDPVEWKTKIASKKGWWKDRALNFEKWTIVDPENRPDDNLVDDAWTRSARYGILLGVNKEVDMSNVGEFIQEVTRIDDERQARIRQRAHQVVKDQDTAKKLEAWYYSFCKRPCFHDEYLPTFNRPGVHLVDTDGKSIERLTPDGIVVNGQEYPVDVLIWSTGYTVAGLSSPSNAGGMHVKGRDGGLLDERWSQGLDTLQGWTAPNWPNMFWAAAPQASASINYTHFLNVQTEHIAQVLAETTRKAGEKKVVIEADPKAAEDWGTRMSMGAMRRAPMSVCTPSYINGEGAMNRMSPEQQGQQARKSPWPTGLPSFEEYITNWRERGDFEGLNITTS